MSDNGNGKLFNLDGSPVDGVENEIVTPSEYMEKLGQRAGFDHKQRDFLRKNLPSMADNPPDHMSRSQRQIYALQQALFKISCDNLQLWALIGAACEAAGGSMEFTQETLKKFSDPKMWAVVVADQDKHVRVALPVTVMPEEPAPAAEPEKEPS